MKFSKMILPASLTIFSLVTSAGCRRNSGDDENRGIIDPDTLIPKDKKEVLELAQRDSSCTTANALNLNDAWIHELTNGAVEAQKVTFATPLIGNPSLASTSISKADLNHYFLMSCDDESCDRGKISSAKIGVDLPICEPSGQYPRATAEDIALTATNAIDKTKLFFDSIPISKPQLEKVALAVHPFLLIPDERGSDKYSPMTDNLTFAPKMGNLGATISVYPKSPVGNKIWPNMSMWESSWVLGHEMSHAIFWAYVAKYVSDSSLSALFSEAILPIINLDVKSGRYRDYSEVSSASNFNLADSKFQRDLSFLVTGINEGFADLFGHLAMNEPSGSYMDGFTCFEKTRSVVSKFGGDEVEKTFSSRNIAKFSSRSDYPSEGEGACNKTIFADNHTLGAFIAYTFNQTFEAFGLVSPQDKAASLLSWIPKLFDVFSDLDNREPSMTVMLNDVLHSFVKHVSADKTLTADSCTQLKSLFPGFMTKWQNSEPFSSAGCRL